MVKSIYIHPTELDQAFEMTRLGARPAVISGILVGFRPTEVEKVVRAYAGAHSLRLPTGPMPLGDAVAMLNCVSRRVLLSVCVLAFERLVSGGADEVTALLTAYRRYTDLARHLKGSDQYVSFERFWSTVRGYQMHTLKFMRCSPCSGSFLVSDNPSANRKCPFCHMRKTGLFKLPALPPQSEATDSARLPRPKKVA